MEISKKNQNEIINSIFEDFKDAKITYDYISRFLDSILKEQTKYDIFSNDIPSLLTSSNPEMTIKYHIKNSIYYKLCLESSNDIDVLLFLTDDKRKIGSLVLKRLGVTDESKLEDYLIEAFSSFNGDENFNTFLTRFIMSKVKGTKFQSKSEIPSPVPQQAQEQPSKKKKKKKKEKTTPYVPPKSNISPVASSITPKEEQPALQETERKEVESPLPLETTGLVIEPPPKILTIVLSNEVPIESPTPLEEKNDDEILSSSKSDVLNPFLECQKRVSNIPGTGTIDTFIRACQETKIVGIVESYGSITYEMYLLLRLGFINKSFYTKEEISNILSLPISEIISYERHTWQEIKSILNNKFNTYEDYILSKTT